MLLIPILDTTLVTVSRALSGRRAVQGGRDHSSHRLVAIGLSERRAVALLWVLAAIGGVLGIGVGNFSQKWSVLLTASAFLIGMVLFAAYLAGIRVYDEADVTGSRARSRRSSSSSCTSAASRRCCSTSAWWRCAITPRTGCASRIRTSS